MAERVETPIKAALFLRRNSDGRFVRTPLDWDFWGEFQWSEGNYRCDCNRALFFARAAGLPEPRNPPCGENAFAIMLQDESGNVLYADGLFKDDLLWLTPDETTGRPSQWYLNKAPCKIVAIGTRDGRPAVFRLCTDSGDEYLIEWSGDELPGVTFEILDHWPGHD